MDLNLRDYIPPLAQDVEKLKKDLEQLRGKESPSKGMDRFIASVQAVKLLENYQAGRNKPSTLSVLIETICLATAQKKEALASCLSVKVSIWKKVLASREEPDCLSPETYAELGRQYRISFQLLKHALIGSFRLCGQTNIALHSRFSQASSKSKNRRRYSQELAEAYQELHLKSAAYRESSIINGKINSFLRAIEKCMN